MQELPLTPQQMTWLLQLAKTEQGRKLFALLQKEKGPEFQRALKNQDYETLKKLAKEFMENPEARALLKELGY